MRNELMRKFITVLLALSLVISTIAFGKEAMAQVFFINITTPDPADFPFGIECGDPNFVYVTIFQDGLLAKIDILNRQVVELIDDPDTDAVLPFQLQSWNSVTRNPNDGNLYISEDGGNGKLWRFVPSSKTFTRIPLIEQVGDPPGGSTIYELGYEVAPNLLRFDTDGDGTADTGLFQVDGGSSNVVFTNGNLWIGLTYSEVFGVPGVDDLDFTGIAKINPETLTVTRIDLSANLVTGIEAIAVDSEDPTILWMSDTGTDSVFRFSTETETVTGGPIDLSILGFLVTPVTLATDSNTVYVALNELGGFENSRIARIDKGTLDVLDPLDTGAENTDQGTFGVFVTNDLLIWSDFSFHVGVIDLVTGEKSFETTETINNRLGCAPLDGEFWFAGEGSARVGILTNSKISVGRPRPNPSSLCNALTYSSDPRARSNCVIVDITPPKIIKAFVTPSDYLCVETKDDVQTVKLTYNGKEIPRWPGSNDFFCTNEELPPVIKVTAEDAAGNKSEMVAINAQEIIRT